MLSSSLTVIGAVLASAVLLGAAYAAFRASDLRATVKDQQARIVSLTTDRDELTREVTEERQQRKLLEGRLALVEDKARHLEEIVSGRIDFSALETGLAHHHTEALRRHDNTEALMHKGFRDVMALLPAKREEDK